MNFIIINLTEPKSQDLYKWSLNKDTHGCSKPQDSAGADSLAGQMAGMTGLNQVNHDMVPAAATPTKDQLAEPTTRWITRNQGAITMNSLQVTRNGNPEHTIRDEFPTRGHRVGAFQNELWVRLQYSTISMGSYVLKHTEDADEWPRMPAMMDFISF